MTDHYEIRDRVPRADIDSLTVEAARVWLERNGWATRERWTHRDGSAMQAYVNGASVLALPEHSRFADHGLRMAQFIEAVAIVAGIRVAQCIAEIRAIGDWQARCKAWVEPKEGEECYCRACNEDLDAPGALPFWECPTCNSDLCPRATDHRNGCSGSNEAGQEGSRYA